MMKASGCGRMLPGVSAKRMPVSTFAGEQPPSLIGVEAHPENWICTNKKLQYYSITLRGQPCCLKHGRKRTAT